MATITAQRDLVAAFKKETCLNVGILSKLQPMSAELSRQIFKENALEKPTQNLFNHMSYYLLCIINPEASLLFSWPLYDTKTEKAYRTQVATFIGSYSNKGLLSPVMSSYLVNPGCFKVTKLIFQLSQLAVHEVFTSKIKKDSQRQLYNDITAKYKAQEKDGFIDEIERETNLILSKFSIYLCKREVMERTAEKLRDKIFQMESKLVATGAQAYIDKLVDGFISKHQLDNVVKTEILQIKKVYKPSLFFDSWLTDLDKQMDDMESKWTEKITPLIKICQDTQLSTESLIARHTGEADKDSHIIEYNHKTDEICTKELQNQVNSQQKFILKNIVKDEKLSFPNLIRGFLIAICYVLKNTEIDDEIYKFDEYFEVGLRNYDEIVKALRDVVNRVMNAEAKLQQSPVAYHHSVSMKDVPEIPPLPDLSDLRCTRELQCQVLFDSFTPLSLSKHQFNLCKRASIHTFIKPQSRSLLVTPFCQAPKDDFMKTLISCRVSDYDRANTQNFHDMSMISQSNRANETIAECSTGFTKQQILRLLSTKKTSSSKKYKHRIERPDSIKKRGLFNESSTSNESNGLFRSYSSPNLFENRETRQLNRAGCRKLSVMQEHSSPILEVSGIVALDRESSCNTPRNMLDAKKFLDASSIPNITITPEPDQKFHNIIKDFKVDLNQEILLEDKQSSIETEKTETPKTNAQLIRKTSSLEKIINRFKKVRANVVTDKEMEQSGDFQTIFEERDNVNGDIVFSANRILLPDLLSPSYSVLGKKSTDFMDQMCMDVDERVCRKPRESLGTALGVDQTFLDQFDLID